MFAMKILLMNSINIVQLKIQKNKMNNCVDDHK